MINEKIRLIREIMVEKKIDAYYITSSDFHESEYIGDYFKVRGYITGFQGSFGSLLITKDKVILWTDSRYNVLAQKILAGTEVEILTVGKIGTPDVKEWMKNNLSKGMTLAFDGRTISAKLGLEFKVCLDKVGIKINESFDIVDKFWVNRPKMPDGKAFLLTLDQSGEESSEKINKVLQEMKKEEADYNLVTSLDDIAWLLNMRGSDIKNTPVVLSNLIIGEEVTLYVENDKVKGAVENTLNKNGIKIKGYNEFYEDIKAIPKDKTILVDMNKVNIMLYEIISKHKIIDKMNPSTILKGVKNNIEIKNIRNAHVKDGVVVTKFIYWLKQNIGKIEIDEISAQEKMDGLRALQKGFIEPSFSTISAYMSNAAMPHYSATKTDFAKLENKGLYLIDSGGQYFDGTTDITRTIAVGDLTEEMKRDYTLVLKGMINLSRAKFLHGTTGSNLDFSARAAMWQYGINYAHGTGHGIGYILGVHEGPHGIRMTHNSHSLVPGMIVSNEPGIYVVGSHGIRIENELLVADFMKNTYGDFYQFETLTYAPIDLEPVIIEMLTCEEKCFLNEYHKSVYNVVANFLEDDEKKWLKGVTKEI